MVVAFGTPEEVAKNAASHTGYYLAPLMNSLAITG
jgi:excinuclease UvrABC ATPase subunit